jgi:hypothetical protein
MITAKKITNILAQKITKNHSKKEHIKLKTKMILNGMSIFYVKIL